MKIAVLTLLLRAPAFVLPAAAGDPPGAAGLVAELRADIEAGDLDAAIRAGEKTIAADPRSSEAHDLLGRAYGLKAQESRLLEQVRLAKKAREFFARAVELDQSNAAALSDLATYDMRAPAILGGGRKKARVEAERVLVLDVSRGRVLLGELAEREKDPARAEAEYRLAVAAAPREARGRRALSTFLVARKRYAEARQVWIEARELDPNDPAADYELAGIALASGEGLALAVGELEDALARPERPERVSRAELHERLARVYERFGRRADAFSELEIAVRLEPHRSEWRKELGRLWR